MIQKLKQDLQRLFDQYGNESYLSISNVSFVQPRIEKLKTELSGLVESISSPQAYPIQDIIEEYKSNYPSQSFSDWFIEWGQKTLRKYQIVARENICLGPLKKENPLKCPKGEVENNPNKVNSERNCEFEIIPKDIDFANEEFNQEKKKEGLLNKDKKRVARVDLYRRKKINKPNGTEISPAHVEQDSHKVESLLPGDNQVIDVNEQNESENGILLGFGKEIWHVFSPLEF